MVLPSSAVTFTLIVFAPSASATWKPVLFRSASVSAMSDAFRYATVALLSDCAGSTVTAAASFATDAV